MLSQSPDEKQPTATAVAMRAFDKLSEADHIDLGTRVSTPAMIDAMRLIDAEYQPVVDALPDPFDLENSAALLDEAPYKAAANRLRLYAMRVRAARAALATLEK